MKPIIPILILVSVLWIFGGSYYMANTSCGSALTAIAPLSIFDDDMNFKANSDQHFSFLPSGHAIAVEKGAGNSFAQVAKHLIDHPGRLLELTGVYLDKEENKSKYENLGIARAEEVKAFLINIEADLTDRISTKGILKNAIYTINGKQIDGVNFAFAEAPKSTSDIIGDLISPEETIEDVVVPTFALYGKEEIEKLQLDINLQQQLDNMRAALDLHPGAYFMVTGHADTGEEAVKSKARASVWAKKVRRFFRNNGVRSKEIKYTSKGAEEPLLSSDDPDAIFKNNRVIVEIVLPK